MPSRAREKQLAKQHARRQAERAAEARRRRIRNGAIGAVAGLAVILGGVAILTGGDDASPTPTPSGSVSPSPTISVTADGTPTKIGEVTTAATPPGQIACDGQVPDGWTAPKPQFDEPPKPKDVLEAKTDYTAIVETSCGTLEIELLRDVAPQTVASFVFLAEQGFFDGVWFHRIAPAFVIQTGDPEGTGAGGPGYSFGIEVDEELNFDHVGQVAMARGEDPNSNGSQWFITTGEASHLSQEYTIFGDVTEGLEVVTEIGDVPPADGTPDTPSLAVYVESVTIRTS